MKKTFIAALVLLSACQPAEEKQETTTTDSVVTTTNTAPPDTVYVDTTTTITPDQPAPATPQVYSNETFKDVKVEQQNGQYVVSGKARVFEAVLSWVLEGANGELKKGHEMTDAGAPAFGNFTFRFDVPAGSRGLKLTLYEASARDGSAQHQLVIPL
ncbi:MAG: Gmad2 immunoglobulin-like domain-containing protein [Flavisolibacter sp.]